MDYEEADRNALIKANKALLKANRPTYCSCWRIGNIHGKSVEHVCSLFSGHSIDHKCECGFTWEHEHEK